MFALCTLTIVALVPQIGTDLSQKGYVEHEDTQISCTPCVTILMILDRSLLYICANGKFVTTELDSGRIDNMQLIPASSGFDHHSAQKDVAHFPNIRSEMGIEYNRMLFFDDEAKNVKKVIYGHIIPNVC